MIESNWEEALCHCSKVKFSDWRISISLSISRECLVKNWWLKVSSFS